MAKVHKTLAERAIVVQSMLEPLAENDLEVQLIKMMDKLGWKTVGVLWWKKPITLDFYKSFITEKFIDHNYKAFTQIKNEHAANPNTKDGVFAVKHYKLGMGWITEKHDDIYAEVRSLIDATTHDHIYLSNEATKWYNDMMSIEQEVHDATTNQV